MNIEEIRNYCLSLRGVTEDFPFDNSILVFRVVNKIFALINIDQCESINLKCEPNEALELREQFNGIEPGWHMNKKHWNTIKFNTDVSDQLMLKLIHNSYQLVVQKLPKYKRLALFQSDN